MFKSLSKVQSAKVAPFTSPNYSSTMVATRSSTPRGRRSGSSPTPQQSSKSSTPKNSSASIKNFSQFPTFPRTPSAVFFYVPNLIGYLRIMCTVVSLLIMDSNLSNPKPNNWKISVILYLCSFVGDMFDGMAARHFDQSSTFGAVLDMLTDRITTAAMLVVLTWIYPSERLFYFCVLALDITSHWLQMYSSLLCKLHHKSKESNEGRFFLVRWFYGNFW